MNKRIIRMLIVVLMAATAWSLRPAPGVQKTGAVTLELIPDPQKVTYETFECPDGNFSVSIPAGWERMDSYPYRIDDTVNGIMLQGPENPESAPMTIAVLHYAGTGSIEGAQHYIKKVLFNPTRLDAAVETKFSDIEVAGVKGTTFTFAKFHLVTLPFEAPPMKEGVMYDMYPPSKKIGMRIRYIVIPAKPGFYSLSYEAPEDMYEDFSGVFDAVAKSFALTGK